MINNPRHQNSLMILQTIDAHDGITSAEISRITGISSATISRVVIALKQRNLVIQTHRPSIGPGRNPDILSLNPNYGYYVYFNIHTDAIRQYLLTFTGRVVFSQSVPVDSSLTVEAFADIVKDFIAYIMANTTIEPDRLLACCIAIPALTDTEKGIVSRVPNYPCFENVNVVEALREHISLPCFIFNDSRLSTVGEYFKYPEDTRSFVYIDVSGERGIGSGIILDGKLLPGSNYNAGEIGDMILRVPAGSAPCETLEGLAGISDLLRKAEQFLARRGILRPEPFDLCALERISVEQPAIAQMIDTTCRYLAAGVVNIVSLISPDAIMIGGAISSENTIFIRDILKHLQSMYFAPIHVDFADPGSEAHLAGAIRMFKLNLFKFVLGNDDE